LYACRAKVFLCVIKDCGPEGKGMLSYPKPGISYALDIPVDGSTQAVVDRLNDFVVAEAGRIYLAKDALTRAEHFRAMEPRLDAFLAVRRAWDPERRLRSAQSLRLLGDVA
jgi:FAD/FMN-containing dehydrogenase